MLVKKIDPAWKPSENPDLAVGATIEITDPKALIVNGYAIGLGKHGEELSAFDLYGVLVKSELDEFREFNEMKKAQALEKKLKDEQKELKTLAASLDDQGTKKVEPVATETAVEKSSVSHASSFGDLRKEAVRRGVYKFGMSKADLLVALK
jgi:hypothetical protein